MDGLIETLKNLVEIPSYPRSEGGAFATGSEAINGENDLAAFIEAELAKTGFFKFKKIPVYGRRYNLVAYTDQEHKADLMFFCHMDTVNPKEKQMENGKLLAKERDGNIFGLGCVDMKGGIAALLYALKNLSAKPKNLIVVFYCDEEFDFQGMKAIIAKEKFEAGLAVFTEPTDLQIANGCRGLIEFSGIVRGETAHPSRELYGLNAILLACQAFNVWKMRIGRFKHEGLGLSTANLAAIDGGLLLGRSDSGALLIGRDGNNIPDVAQLVLEVRTSRTELNGKTASTMFKELVEAGGGRFELTGIRHDLGAFFTDSRDLSLAEKAIAEAVGSVSYGDLSASGYYDAQMLAERFNIPCISFGPGPKSASHKEDEYVHIADLEKTSSAYTNMIKSCSGR